jgi:two-component system OmpR family response regulator
MRVLLVEDHRDLREQLRRTLQAIGGVQVVQTCTTSAEAVEWLARHPEHWDLALVDLFLQEGNGFDVLRSCQRRAAHQRVVVISNYSREPAREHARQAGADAFFDKSFDLDALVQYCVSHAAACRPRAAPARASAPAARRRQAAGPGERT